MPPFLRDLKYLFTREGLKLYDKTDNCSEFLSAIKLTTDYGLNKCMWLYIASCY